MTGLPICIPPRRIARVLQQVVSENIEEMFKYDIIRTSKARIAPRSYKFQIIPEVKDFTLFIVD